MKILSIVLNFSFLLAYFEIFSQITFSNHYVWLNFEKSTLENQNIFHNLRPSINFDYCDSSNSKKTFNPFKYDLITIKHNDLLIKSNLLITYFKSKDTSNKNFYQNSRGFNIYGFLGEKIFFYTDFYENQAYFPYYIDSAVNYTLATLGQGVWKIFGKDLKGKDFNYINGFLSINWNKYLNLTFGLSKFFIGNGYRSLILSDNASPFPFLNFNLKFSKVYYQLIFTEFENFKVKYYYTHTKKYGKYIILAYKPTKNIELTFVDATLWPTIQKGLYKNAVNYKYFVPIPIFQNTTSVLDSTKNEILAANIFLTNNFLGIYTQFVLNKWGKTNFEKRYGFQIGIKIYDILLNNFKNTRFSTILEYNHCQPFVYSSNKENLSFSHLNESLTSPIGANYKEFLIIGIFEIKRFRAFFQYNNILTSYDEPQTNYGRDILKPNSTATAAYMANVGYGNHTKIKILKLRLSFVLNPKIDWQIFIEKNYRIPEFVNKKSENYLSFGIISYIWNVYTDF